MPQISKEQIEQVIAALCIAEHADEGECDAAKLMLQGLLGQPEDDGSDWFYKLKFICRVLDGASPDKTDMRTALGMARSLFEEKHAAGMALLSPAPFTPITADMVTDDMLEVIEDEISMGRNAWDLASHKELVAAAVNVWGAKK